MNARVEIPEERPGRPADPDLADRRGQMELGVQAGAFRTERPAVEETFAGARALRFSPDGEPKGYLLQLHGGGFRIGRPEFEGPLSEKLAARCGIEVIVPQYRLSPEGPFPAGLNDALAALKALREQVGEAIVLVGGDSAGGGLAASLGVLAAAGLAPRIDGLVLLSPWLDLTVTAPAFAENADTDPMFSEEQANIAAELYLQGFDPEHPLASPLFAPVEGYPPSLISVGTGEVLRDDSLRFHEKLLAAGVRSRLSAIDGMEHVAVVRSPDLTGSAETFDEIVRFIDARLSA
ncbi:MAG: alpha/beta hydrolase [Novosphingobium sp.]|nr:alpha/beta hydrolase [Novosphingobium sp.]